ncbi:MAG: glycosyltransferase family 39 protein [bacterium]|nr:glycosyltransferase family 39 protein [bacterium]
MRNRWFVASILGLLAALGVGLRLIGASVRPLWQDEAESVIYAQQILEDGYPHDTFRGERLYETRSFLPDDDPKYEFVSTNFAGSRFEKNKGWLPYYLMAGSFRLFGVGAWQARLPAAIFGGLTVSAAYLLARLVLPPPASLLVAALQAGNPLAVAAEGQARYYAALTLAFTLAVVAFERWRRSRQKKNWWLAVGGVIALFYTHAPLAVYLGAAGVFAAVQTLGWPGLLRSARWWAGVTAIVAATLPWVLLVNMPAVWRYAGSDPLHFRPMWLTLVAAVTLAAFGIALVWHPLRARLQALPSPLRGWLLLCGSYTAVLPLLLPAESVAERLFFPLLPLLAVLGVALVKPPFPHGSQRAAQVVLAAGFLLAVVGGLTLLTVNSSRRSAPYRAEWVSPLVAKLQAENALSGRLLLTDYQQFPLTVASGLPFQLLSVLRCSYLQTYPEPVLYLRHPVLTDRGWVVALPYCNPGETACEQRTHERFACLTSGRACKTTERDGTLVTTCGAPRSL